ncbi:MAG: type 1 glutamine amidotransferase domain-containing protein [Gammaproteobacteria bacterium]|nr:type 1 glutamine amidotransferase domain-containing protein [Gammaproteobacteria bacterium]
MASTAKKVLIVVTSHDRLSDTGKQTGFWFEELATPYYVFVDAGYTVDIASINGGKPPVDPGSEGEPGNRPASVQRFMTDSSAMNKLEKSLAIQAADTKPYDAIFLSGGHGAMWDMPSNTPLATALGAAFDAGKVIAAVCHGPAGLVSARRKDGKSIVHGRRVNSFTDTEESAVGLSSVVPFLLESRLRELGGIFERAPDWQPIAVRDGNLVTGQNPQSSHVVAEQVIEALR